MKIIFFAFVSLMAVLLFFWQQPVGKNDIYINRLVYLRKDSCLFTGTLKVINKASNYYETFYKGLPCGEWAERQNGGSYISKGEYISVDKILSKETCEKLVNDTVIINYWQEGGDLASDPYQLNVIILKKDAFFESDGTLSEKYTDQLANLVIKDTHNLKYEYLRISFVNSIRDWNRDFSKLYKIVGGNLQKVQ